MAEWQAAAGEREAALAGVAGGMDDAKTGAAAEPQYVAYVPLPDEKEIEARVVERKKAELLARYSTPALQQVRPVGPEPLSLENDVLKLKGSVGGSLLTKRLPRACMHL